MIDDQYCIQRKQWLESKPMQPNKKLFWKAFIIRLFKTY